MSLSPDGKTLLSNSMDNTVRAWDVQPFVSGDRMIKIFLGGSIFAPLFYFIFTAMQ